MVVERSQHRTPSGLRRILRSSYRRLLSAAGASAGVDPSNDRKGPDLGLGLFPGDRHYRAYVGPPEDYDRIGGLQFGLLFALGLREHHRLGDLGCGSLRAGKLLIPYLAPGHYFGIEPNRWLIEEAIEREVGRDLIARKNPSFLHVESFDLASFGVELDFVLAQSIFSHTYPDRLAAALREVARALAPKGILVATFVAGDGPGAGSGWRYPECVSYSWPDIARHVADAGMVGRLVDWPHPRQRWFLAARTPFEAELDALAARVRRPLRDETSVGDRVNEYDRQLTDDEIAAKAHRALVGGLWDELGLLQLDFLTRRGLRPGDRLLDIGCGALRGGLHFIRYLEPGRYYGVDGNASLIRAGRLELEEAGLGHRDPLLVVDADFRFEAFEVRFPFAIAQSLFTHLPLNKIERCLVNVAAVLEPGGRLYATYFESPEPHAYREITHPGGTVTHGDRDPFHYHYSVFELLTRGLPLEVRNVGSWNHPRSQHMLEFTRT